MFHYNGQAFRTQRELGQHLVPIVGRSLSRVLAMLKDHDNDGDVVVELYRKADDIDAYGPLARELRQTCRDHVTNNLDDFTVLTRDNDPYRYDKPTGRQNANRFAEIMNQLVPSHRSVHLRGLHYMLVTSTAILKPDGMPYRNTDEDWVWLQDAPANAARWLGTVPFERIIDERNDPPILPSEEGTTAAGVWHSLVSGMRPDIPDFEQALPRLHVNVSAARQPYRIILFGEKSSLSTVLAPIRNLVNGELLLPTGESSTTMVFNLAQRCATDGRPSVVLYFSDFDPAGWQMGVSVARKLQALKTLRFPELDVTLYPVALTFKQVTRLDLPSTPLKETEKRADKWRAKWGHEQTEIDALAALNPAELTRIARAAVAPFFDPTLIRRTAELRDHARNIAEQTLAAHPRYEAARDAISNAMNNLEAAADQLAAVQAEAVDDLGLDDIELPDLPEVPQPEISAEAPAPLFTTDDDYPTATLRLKAHKALDGD